MDEQLKDAFANHYKSKSLSAEQIERLNALTETDNPAPRYTRKALMGACAMVILLTALFFQPFVQPSKDITSMIAAEVAKNHIKMRPMEIKSQSYLRYEEGIVLYMPITTFPATLFVQ